MTPDERRLSHLGYGSPKGYKLTRTGRLKPVTDKEIRKTLRARRRKALIKTAPTRAVKKALKKVRPRKVKFPFHPFMLMREAQTLTDKVGRLSLNPPESVAINSTLTRQQCRDLARLDRQKRLANRSWLGSEVYTICATKKGTPLEQVYPFTKILHVSETKKAK